MNSKHSRTRWIGEAATGNKAARGKQLCLYGRACAALVAALSTYPTFAEKSDREMTREEAKAAAHIQPWEFPGLPQAIATDLEQADCTIPKAYFLSGFQNAITGEFTRPGQTDWAVICAHADAMSLRVYRNGQLPAEMVGRSWNDQFRLVPDNQSSSDPHWIYGYNYKISALNRDTIVAHAGYGGPTPPPIDHQGLDLYCCEEASTTYYWYENQWLPLGGAD